MKLIFATHNKHKITELKAMLEDTNIEIISLTDLNDFDEVEETGSTFLENATLKAKYFYDKYHINTISDDSGLCVEALNNAPGVYSARYSSGTDDDNIDLLLKNMENEKNRKAYFCSNICYYDGQAHNFEGYCHGEIGYKRYGNNGFGYDPIFMVGSSSFATLSLEEKNKISHRHNALVKFVDYISKISGK